MYTEVRFWLIKTVPILKGLKGPIIFERIIVPHLDNRLKKGVMVSEWEDVFSTCKYSKIYKESGDGNR